MKEPVAKTTNVIRIEDLPDELAQSECLWMITTLSHAMALRECYRLITGDRKAFADWDRVCEDTMKGIRRIYPTNEANYLITMALKTGQEAAERQHKLHLEAEAEEEAAKNRELALQEVSA